MGLEKFLHRTSQELPHGLNKEAGKILAKANNWALEQTKRFKFNRQPFNLSEQEIEVIHTRLTELRSEQHLGKIPLRHAVETAEITLSLGNYFRGKYQEILQKVIENFEIVSQAEVGAVWNYLENCKELAPNFAKGRSDSMELMGICNRIHSKKPMIMMIKTGSTNS